MHVTYSSKMQYFANIYLYENSLSLKAIYVKSLNVTDFEKFPLQRRHFRIFMLYYCFTPTRLYWLPLIYKNKHFVNRETYSDVFCMINFHALVFEVYCLSCWCFLTYVKEIFYLENGIIFTKNL